MLGHKYLNNDQMDVLVIHIHVLKKIMVIKISFQGGFKVVSTVLDVQFYLYIYL